MRERMRGTMAGNTGHTVCREIVGEGPVTFHLLPFWGFSMTIKTIRIGIASGVFDWFLVRIGYVIQPVAKTISFPFDGTIDTIRYMASVALILGNPAVSVVPRGE
jgi:hypothetical protein